MHRLEIQFINMKLLNITRQQETKQVLVLHCCALF